MIRFNTLFLLALGSLWSLAQTPPLHGFVETRLGHRLSEDPQQDQLSLAELRLQLELNQSFDLMDYFAILVRADFKYDDLDEDHGQLDLESGQGFLDLREANLQFAPTGVLDVKIGRQILTWGTGDLLFINDLFPKDWQSFFAGRDQEYLKAPSDAVRLTGYLRGFEADLVYVPTFDNDRFISGARFSYYNPVTGGSAGRDQIVETMPRQRMFRDDEWSLRLAKNVAGLEWAAYGYDGYWKSPRGFDPESGLAAYPRLRVLGASLRGTVGKGLLNGEVGHYRSLDDPGGRNPLIPNDEWRLLLGYESELARNLNGAFQYYLEHMSNHSAYRAGQPEGAPLADRDRHVLTNRLTLRRRKDTLTLSLFTYFSPSDSDGYTRPNISYKATDAWQLTFGGNVFWGSQKHTFFGQFEKGSNLYASTRFSF